LSQSRSKTRSISHYYFDPDYEELDATPAVNVPTQTMDLDEGAASGGKELALFELMQRPGHKFKICRSLS